MREWTEGGWREITAPPAAAGDCPQPQQTAVLRGQVVVWSDRDHPTFVYDLVTERWEQAEPVPLERIDRPSGPLPIGDRFLVPRGPEGAIFDPATRTWQAVDLPGHGTDSTMVWTGKEVLMWDRCCYEPDDVDAWRWTPPPGP